MHRLPLRKGERAQRRRGVEIEVSSSPGEMRWADRSTKPEPFTECFPWKTRNQAGFTVGSKFS